MDMGIIKSLLFTISLVMIGSTWAVTYSSARKARRYSQGRQAVKNDDSFKIIGIIIFTASHFVTFASFWSNAKLLALYWSDDVWRATGLAVLIAATRLHISSMRYLGNNYSPCFDAHMPLQIIMQGPYRYVRHPVYLANVL